MPITNEIEVTGLADALIKTEKKGWEGVHSHLMEATRILSGKKDHDFRNSIKESILAVEAAAKLISNQPKATLGPALNALSKKFDIHPALKDGFLNIYGYTSDAGGIRHGLVDATKVDLAEAKFMLVACSAFVTYLIEKSS